jgi:hypothetical protein
MANSKIKAIESTPRGLRDDDDFFLKIFAVYPESVKIQE